MHRVANTPTHIDRNTQPASIGMGPDRILQARINNLFFNRDLTGAMGTSLVTFAILTVLTHSSTPLETSLVSLTAGAIYLIFSRTFREG